MRTTSKAATHDGGDTVTTRQHFDKTYGTNAAQNYEDLFVPRIGRPCAEALIGIAGAHTGERVLDVACGTGIAARLSAERTGAGNVTGVDINAGMLAVARSLAPDIDWREGTADALPAEDSSTDVVLCSLGLMFFPDRPAAVAEMHRVLTSGGRAGALVPGPTPEPMVIFADALARHVDPELRGFVHAVFSLNDGAEIEQLFTGAGFTDVSLEVVEPTIPLGPPREFLWDYIHATPLAAAVLAADEAQRSALEDDVLAGWRDHIDGDDFVMTVRNTIAVGHKD
jgi:ubiquinone/menaquinone biosynthesis C-methylase UbiE